MPPASPQQLQQLLQQGRLQEARALSLKLCQQRPNDATVHAMAGMLAVRFGLLEEAVAHYQAALRLQPAYSAVHDHLGILFSRLGRLDQAIGHFQTALRLQPGQAVTCNNLGVAYKEKGELDKAEECYRHALRLRPGYAEAHNNLGVVLSSRGRLVQAESCFRRALQAQADHLAALGNLGNVLQAQACIAEADAVYQRARQLAPDNAEVHSKRLFNLNYGDDYDAEAVFAAHRRWDQEHGQPPGQAPAFANAVDPGRRLRVAYLSPDFRAHSVAYFLEPLLAHHDKLAVEVYCYADVTEADDTTRRLREYADHWLNTCGMGHEQLAARIREDVIDILVDLTGHTAGNRLPVFALRPAPCQVAWLGYPNTTGLAAMGYRLSDAIADPPGDSEAYHSERLIHLEHGFLCYRGRNVSVPDRQKGHADGAITFGSFNNLAKLGPALLSLWADILKQVPRSRLLLKNRSLEDPACRERMTQFFGRRGIAADRLELRGWLDKPEEHLELYEKIDIALDSFPYNGTTTTCEALWMGVPVITLRGTRHAARVGASILTRIGLPELIATDHHAYLRLARELAGDHERRRCLHRELRQRMETSPLCDGEGFSREVEKAYRRIWGEWCRADSEDGPS